MSRAFAAALACGVLLTGCSGSSEGSAASLPAEDAFRDGDCRTAAPEILAIGRTLPRLDAKRTLPQEVKDVLQDSQAVLFAIAERAEATVKPKLSDTVEKIGIVRIRADSNTYEAAQGEGLRRSYEALVQACTMPA